MPTTASLRDGEWRCHSASSDVFPELPLSEGDAASLQPSPRTLRPFGPTCGRSVAGSGAVGKEEY